MGYSRRSQNRELFWWPTWWELVVETAIRWIWVKFGHLGTWTVEVFAIVTSYGIIWLYLYL